MESKSVFDFLAEDEQRVLLGEERGEPITTEEAQRRLGEAIRYALKHAESTLIDAPTGLGKTHTVATTPWREHPDLTGGRPVIHLSQTKEARDSAIGMSESAGLSYAVLRAREEVCPVANGEFDSEIKGPDGEVASRWFDRKCDVEQITFSAAHDFLSTHNGSLPCSEDGPCESKLQWVNLYEGIENGEFDVIHATAQFAKVAPLIEDANVFYDEIPDYRVEASQELIRTALNRLFVRRFPDGNLTWAKLIEHAKDNRTLKGLYSASYDESGDVLELRQNEPKADDPKVRSHLDETIEILRWIVFDEDEGISLDSNQPVHTRVPAIARATLLAHEVANQRYLGRSSNLRVVFDSSNTYRLILDPPELSSARCIIGLDAHPSERLWRLHTGVDFERGDLLSSEERVYWRRQERGLYVVQIDQSTNPLTNGWRSERQRTVAAALIQELRRKAGPLFRTAIVPKAIKDDVRQLMKESGINDPQLLHYGGEKSLNTFAEEQVGLLLGCIDPGDHYILNYLAALGLDAEPEMYETEDGSKRRKHGRGFIGEDADAAAEFLASVRETHIAQSIGRYARNPQHSDSGAVVYVWTDAIPEGMRDGYVEGVKTQLSKNGDLPVVMQRIMNCIREAGEPMTAKSVSDSIGCDRTYAWRILEEMLRQGIVSISIGTGKSAASEYEWIGGEFGPEVDMTIRSN